MRPRRSSRPLSQTDSLGSFATGLIESLGGRPTPRATKFFRAWQQREGGWTANAARYNPLNLTAPGSGLPTINSVGVVAMPTMQAGIARTARLLRSGYPALARALASGNVSIADPAVQADLNRWVSGKRTPGMSQYVRGIASAFGSGSPLPDAAIPPQLPAAGVEQPARFAGRAKFGPPHLDLGLYGKNILQQFAAGGGRINLTSLPQLQRASFVQSPLKQLPTQTVQQRGIVDPGGHLIDPAGVNSNMAVKAASTQIGKPYVFGSGPSTASFD